MTTRFHVVKLLMERDTLSTLRAVDSVALRTIAQGLLPADQSLNRRSHGDMVAAMDASGELDHVLLAIAIGEQDRRR